MKEGPKSDVGAQLKCNTIFINEYLVLPVFYNNSFIFITLFAILLQGQNHYWWTNYWMWRKELVKEKKKKEEKAYL